MTINSEDIIKSLLAVGFEEVTSDLFIYVLVNFDNRTFTYNDEAFSDIFNKYIIFDGISFRIKDDYSLDTTVYLYGNINFKLKDYLNSNFNFVEALKKLNFDNYMPRQKK